MMGRLAPHLTLARRLGRAMLEPQVRLASGQAGAGGSRAALILLRPDKTVAFADEAGELALAVQDICRVDFRGRTTS